MNNMLFGLAAISGDYFAGMATGLVVGVVLTFAGVAALLVINQRALLSRERAAKAARKPQAVAKPAPAAPAPPAAVQAPVAAPVPVPVAAAPAAAPVLDPGIDPELLAVITAACMAVLKKNVRIRHVRFVTATAGSNWTGQGRTAIHSSHSIQKGAR